MKTAAVSFCLILVLTAVVHASVTFTPPGSTKPMIGNAYTMMPTSEAAKMKSTASLKLGRSKDQKTWMADVAIKGGHKNGLYGVWLTNRTSRMLGMPVKADAKGDVKISYMGTINPMSYKSLNVYYLPDAKATPAKGAVLMFSKAISSIPKS